MAEGYQLLLADEQCGGNDFPAGESAVAACLEVRQPPAHLRSDRAAGSRNGPELLDAVLATGFTEGASSKKLGWASLVDIGVRESNQAEALRILRSRRLDDLLNLLDAGRLEDITDPTAPPEARAQVHSRLSIVLHAQIAKAGAAH
ncbi:hypothetical protein [Amycolatopsis rubida]|uniref:Uncharacterized protein n=1 Tax=Amycolatopsis rubida TaxID=112413 RepID=A0A1I5G4D6_9PSEU|nr:hypothetical protein [Amycolatopsis rubida]SFO30895.1 hypothetical protein SAMN05421854_1011435 [Amycolatopsis rubida]